MKNLNDFKTFLKTLSEEELKNLINLINSTCHKKEDITNSCLSSFLFSYNHITGNILEGRLEYVDDILVLKCNDNTRIESPVLEQLIVKKFKLNNL